MSSALALDGQRLLSWSGDHTLRLWDATTSSPIAVLERPTDWARAPREHTAAMAQHRPGDRAMHHALHLGFTVADTRDDLAILTGGRHVRICRFVPERPE